MQQYVIAELPVAYDAAYPTLRRNSERYRSDTPPEAMLCVVPEELEALRKKSPLLNEDQREYMLIGKAFYHHLLRYHGLMLHASAVVVDNEAYLFSAPSGTGKSTHTSLWLEHFGEKAYILNDDKPAIRIFPDGVYAYGTPFSGKYDISVNAKVPLRGIAFIERSESNDLERQTKKQAMFSILNQTARPEDVMLYTQLLATVGELLDRVNVFTLHCNISREAVSVSYEGMRKGTV